MEKTAVSPLRYFILAFIVFAFLGSEFIVLILSTIVDGRSLDQYGSWPVNWYGAVFHWSVTIFIWGLAALFFSMWAAKKQVFSELISFKINSKVLIYTVASVVIVILAAIIENRLTGARIPQIYSEYLGFQNMYGGNALVVTLFQNIYYIFEMVLVLIMLVFFQKAGELWFKWEKVPWGSIGIMLTWGLIHFISHPEGALGVTIWAIVPGLMYIISKKSFYPVYALLLLGFII